jgi:hypothetical protein
MERFVILYAHMPTSGLGKNLATAQFNDEIAKFLYHNHLE